MLRGYLIHQHHCGYHIREGVGAGTSEGRFVGDYYNQEHIVPRGLLVCFCWVDTSKGIN